MHHPYHLDSDEEIAEWSGGALVRRFVPGPGIDRPIAMVMADGGKRYFHQDRLGSVVALSDEGGALADGPYAYDPYGAPQGTSPAATAADSPYLFTGRRYDAETGLYYYRARYYAPLWGRFLQTDPVGYEDDLNLYAYVGNDPVNGTDPTGEIWGAPRYSGGTSAAQLTAALKYASRSPTARGEYKVVSRSRETFVISVEAQGDTWFDPENNVVHWNPTRGLKLPDGTIISPSRLLFHEITHAAQRAILVRNAFHSSNRGYTGGGASEEEQRATSIENRIGIEVGEKTQRTFGEGRPVQVQGPTSRRTSPAAQLGWSVDGSRISGCRASDSRLGTGCGGQGGL